MCPSKDLTLTPRQRVVVCHGMARAEASGDHALAASLEKDYDYSGVDTCAVDGTCVTACPVLIDTGKLVKRLRRESANPVLATGWKAAATAWGPVTRAGSLALTAADAVPVGLVRAATTVGRAVLGDDTWREVMARRVIGAVRAASGDVAPVVDSLVLHPELTASATAAEAAEVRALDADAHASCNRRARSA